MIDRELTVHGKRKKISVHPVQTENWTELNRSEPVHSHSVWISVQFSIWFSKISKSSVHSLAKWLRTKLNWTLATLDPPSAASSWCRWCLWVHEWDHVDRHDTQPFTGSSSHTHTVMVGGGRKGLGRLKPSTTGSKPVLNLLNLNLGVWFKVQQIAEPNLFCGFRFSQKCPNLHWTKPWTV